jgi:hypothetical protein
MQVLLETLAVTQLVKKFLSYVTGRFIMMFVKALA